VRNPGADQVEARRWATLAVPCLSLLVVVVDNTIVDVALTPVQSERPEAPRSVVQATGGGTPSALAASR
jgi:hypothetical protein